MGDKEERVIAVVEGRATAFTNTEKVTYKTKTGEIETGMAYDVVIADEDGHAVKLRSPKPWDIRPGEWVRVRMERTQARLPSAEA